MTTCSICDRPLHHQSIGDLCADHYHQARTAQRAANEKRVAELVAQRKTIREIVEITGLSDYSARKFANIQKPPRVRTRTMADILRTASALAEMPVATITSKSKLRKVVMIRQAVCLIGVECNHSASQVARMVGLRDHTTVAHSVKRARAHAAARSDYAHFIGALRVTSTEERPAEPCMPETVPNQKHQPVRHWDARPALAIPSTVKPRNDFNATPCEQDDSHRFHAAISKGSRNLLMALRAAA